MGYIKIDYTYEGLAEYIQEEDLSLSLSPKFEGSKIVKYTVFSVHARKPIIIEELSSGEFCVYEQHKHSKRHISIHKTYKGVLGRINVLIDRYGETKSYDDM